ncbi:MAG TPA: hypothetical protein VM261_38310 [Kofleriaceae bacterium]|nr:hypothetical protein [Kofleriaceae bacterium]
MRAALLVTAGAALLAGACATSHQSARVLAPGKTQVTTALARTSATEGGLDEGIWTGDLQVHGGVAPGFELGGRLVRTPGGGNTGSIASIEGRFQVVPERVSIALPVGVVWQEELDDFEGGNFFLTPTVFVGTDVSPTMELIAAPKLFVFIPDDGDDDTEVEIGGSVGLRITNEARTWAVHPELGIIQFSEGTDATWITFGLGISVGN